MKYQESYLGSKAEFGDFIKKAVPELFAGKLVVEGKTVGLPLEADLDYKVKYDEDEEGGAITFKVTWEKASDVELNLDE
jgi:amphi-Trp domain-containing protein